MFSPLVFSPFTFSPLAFAHALPLAIPFWGMLTIDSDWTDRKIVVRLGLTWNERT
jgi:hypothetical protein